MEKAKPLFVKPVEAAALLGMGKSKMYAMLASGEIASVRISGMLRVPVAALEKLVQDAMGAEAGRESR